MNSLELQLDDKGLEVEYHLSILVDGSEVGHISGFTQESLEEEMGKSKIAAMLRDKLKEVEAEEEDIRETLNELIPSIREA